MNTLRILTLQAVKSHALNPLVTWSNQPDAEARIMKVSPDLSSLTKKSVQDIFSISVETL